MSDEVNVRADWQDELDTRRLARALLALVAHLSPPEAAEDPSADEASAS